MNFPHWSPGALQEAYRTLQSVATIDWMRDELYKPALMRFDQHTPADYLIGIGKAPDTLGVIVKLATDLRMKDVWLKLSKLENDARNGKLGPAFDLGQEIVSCGIAALCAYSIVEHEESVTRASWMERHEHVAQLASELSGLLKPSSSLDESFQNIAWMFTPKNFRDIAGELHGFILPTAYPDGPPTIEELEELEESIEKETPEEIAASNAIWDKEVDNLAYWLKSSLTRYRSVSCADVLDQMAELAQRAARNPPFVAPSDQVLRHVFMLSGGLFTYFSRFFARPLDDVVATIASVITDQDVSAEAVKMRRRRWHQHVSRPLR